MNKYKLTPVFKSGLPFVDGHKAKLLLVYCSDFRFRRHFWEFQRRVLGDKEIDRVIQPGGHLMLFGSELGYPKADLAEKFWMEFLAVNHHINQVILVGHAGCAAYAKAKKLQGKTTGELREQQIQDLFRAKKVLEKKLPKVKVKLYFAEPEKNNKNVIFSRVR